MALTLNCVGLSGLEVQQQFNLRTLSRDADLEITSIYLSVKAIDYNDTTPRVYVN